MIRFTITPAMSEKYIEKKVTDICEELELFFDMDLEGPKEWYFETSEEFQIDITDNKTEWDYEQFASDYVREEEGDYHLQLESFPEGQIITLRLHNNP